MTPDEEEEDENFVPANFERLQEALNEHSAQYARKLASGRNPS